MAFDVQAWRKAYVLARIEPTAEPTVAVQTESEACFRWDSWRGAIPVKTTSFRAIGCANDEEWHKLCGIAAKYLRERGFYVETDGGTYSYSDGGLLIASKVNRDNKFNGQQCTAERIYIAGPKSRRVDPDDEDSPREYYW